MKYMDQNAEILIFSSSSVKKIHFGFGQSYFIFLSLSSLCLHNKVGLGNRQSFNFLSSTVV